MLRVRVLHLRYGQPRYNAAALLLGLVALLAVVLTTDVTKVSWRGKRPLKPGKLCRDPTRRRWASCPRCSGHGRRPLLGHLGPCACDAGCVASASSKSNVAVSLRI